MGQRRRRLGQHWLANDDLAASLVRLIDPRPGDRFLEIGPGHGRLTLQLLRHPLELVAVEIDAACCESLARLAPVNNLHVCQADVLTLTLDQLAPQGQLRIVGNLPYSAASPILRWTVDQGTRVEDAHYMLPAGVAERLLASPGERSCGLLTILMQWEFEVRGLLRLGPGAFVPSPRVESCFVGLRRRQPIPCQASRAHRISVIEAAFSHRRKTLSNSLMLAKWREQDVLGACERAEIDPRCRAENLQLAAFARLAEALPRRRR